MRAFASKFLRIAFSRLSFFALIFLVSGNLYSQNPEKSFTEKLNGARTSSKELVKSATSESSSVGETGEMRVSIPIVTVKSRTMSFPIQLSYQSGIKTGDKSGSVGLGWNMPSGSITRDYGAFQPDYSSTANEAEMLDWDGVGLTDANINPNHDFVNPVNYNKLLTYDAIDISNGNGTIADKYHIAVPGMEGNAFWNNGAANSNHSWEWNHFTNSKVDFDVQLYTIAQEFSRINDIAVKAAGTPNPNDKTKFNMMMPGSWSAAIGVLPYVKYGKAERPTSVIPSANERFVEYEDFKSFTVTDESGTKYVFGRALRGQKYIFNDDPYWSSVDNSLSNSNNNHFWKIDFIAEWLLTEILSVDYVDVNGNGIADDGDAGDWIRFEYTDPTKTDITVPQGILPGSKMSQVVPMHREWSNFSQTGQASSLMRERAYLAKIVTPTEMYDFKISQRFDVDHDFYSKPANKVGNYFYFEDREYSTNGSPSASEKDFDVRFPVETMKYDTIYSYSRLIDQINYPKENLLKGSIAFNYADKGSPEELAVSSYLIRNNFNIDKLKDKPSDTDDFDIEKYHDNSIKRGKTTLLSVDVLDANLDPNDKLSYTFDYTYNPSYDEIHKREIVRKYFFPSLRAATHDYPNNNSSINIDYVERLVGSNGHYTSSPQNHYDIKPYDFLIDYPYEEVYYTYDGITEQDRKDYVEDNSDVPSGQAVLTSYVSHPLKPVKDVYGYFYSENSLKSSEAWTLTGITYPLGGIAEFEYERGEYDVANDKLTWKYDDKSLPLVPDYNGLAKIRSLRQDLYNQYAFDINSNPLGVTDPVTGYSEAKTLTAAFNVTLSPFNGIRLKKKTINDRINPVVTIEYEYGTGHFTNLPSAYVQNLYMGFNSFMTREKKRHDWERLYHNAALTNGSVGWKNDFESKMGLNVRTDITLHDYTSSFFYEDKSELFSDGSRIKSTFFSAANDNMLDYRVATVFRRTKTTPSIEGAGYILGGGTGTAKEVDLKKKEYFDASDLINPYKKEEYIYTYLTSTPTSDFINFLNVGVQEFLWADGIGFDIWLPVSKKGSPHLTPSKYFYQHSSADLLFNLFPAPIIFVDESWNSTGSSGSDPSDPTQDGPIFSQVLNHSINYPTTVTFSTVTSFKKTKTLLQQKIETYKGLSNTTSYVYDNKQRLMETSESNNSDPDVIITKLKYADDSYLGLTTKFDDLNLLNVPTETTVFLNISTSNTTVLSANVSTFDYSENVPRKESDYIFEWNYTDPELATFSMIPFNFSSPSNAVPYWRKNEVSNSDYNVDGIATLNKTNRIFTKSVLGNSQGSVKAQISSVDREFDGTYSGFEDIHERHHISEFDPSKHLDEKWYTDVLTTTMHSSIINANSHNLCGQTASWLDQYSVGFYHLVTVDDASTAVQGDPVSLNFTLNGTTTNFQTTIASVHHLNELPPNYFGANATYEDYFLCFTDNINFPFETIPSNNGNEDPMLVENENHTLSLSITSSVHNLSKTYARTGKYSYKLPSKATSGVLAKQTAIRPVKILASNIPTECTGPLGNEDPSENDPENNGVDDDCFVPYEASVWLRYDFNIPSLGGDNVIITKSQDANADQIYRRESVTQTNNGSGVRIVCEIWNSPHTLKYGQYDFYPENLNDLWQQYTIDIPLLKSSSDRFIDVYVINEKIKDPSVPSYAGKSLFVDDIVVYPKGAKYIYNTIDKFQNTTFTTNNNDVYIENSYDNSGRVIANKNAYGKTIAESFYFNQAAIPNQNNHVTERLWTNNGQFNDTRYFLDGFGKTKQVMKSDLVRNLRVVSESSVYNDKGNVIESYKPYFLVGSGFSNKYDSGFASKVSTLYGTNYGYKSWVYEAKPEEMISMVNSPRTNLESPISASQNLSLNTIMITNVNWPTQTYGVGTLFVKELQDQIGSLIRTYIDARGKVIMKETVIGLTGHTQNADGSISISVNAAESAQTWFLYDKMGRLIKTFDPTGLVSHYYYNSANLLLKTDLPDKGELEMRYNNYNQIRLTKNERDVVAESNSIYSSKQMEFIKYDKWGRVIEDGVLTVAPNNLGVSTTNPPFSTDDYFNDYSYINDIEFPNSNIVFKQLHHEYIYDGDRDQFSSNRLLKEITYSEHYLGAAYLYTQNHIDEVSYEYMADGQLAKKEYLVDGLNDPHSFQFKYNAFRLPTGKLYIHGGDPAKNFEWRNEVDYWGRPVSQTTVYNSNSNLISRDYFDPIGNRIITGVGPTNATNNHLDYNILKLNIRNELTGQMTKNFNLGLLYDASGNVTNQYWRNSEFDPASISSAHINRYDYTYDGMKRLIGADYSDITMNTSPFQSIDNLISSLPDDYTCGPQVEVAYETVQPVLVQLQLDLTESAQPEIAREALDVLNLLISEYVSMAIPYATLSTEEKTSFYNSFFDRAIASEEDFYAFEKYKAYQQDDQEHLDVLYATEEADETLLIYTKDLLTLMPHEYPVVCYPNANSIVHNFSPNFPIPASTSSSNKYDAAYWYSKNGNTTQLNRSNEVGSKSIQQYNYGNAKNWLTSVDWSVAGSTVPPDTKTYSYDPLGNLTFDEKTYQNTDFSYNLFSNMPEKISSGANGATKFRYNAQNRRTVKEISAFDTEYYIEEIILDHLGNVKSYQTSNGYALPISTSSIEYYYNIKDWLGSNRVVIDELGTVINATDHYPYGEKLPGRALIGGVEEDRYQFTGHELDAQTSYEYHGARFYDRALGRYLGADPLNSKAPNWSTYRYGFDNPINYLDKNGLFESREEARAYKKKHNREAVIRKNKDGTFNVTNKYTGQYWAKATQWEVDNGYANSEGVMEGAFALENKMTDKQKIDFLYSWASNTGSLLWITEETTSRFVATDYKSATNPVALAKLKTKVWRYEGTLGKPGYKVFKIIKIAGNVAVLATPIFHAYSMYQKPSGTIETIEYVDLGVETASAGIVILSMLGYVSSPVGWGAATVSGVYGAVRYAQEGDASDFDDGFRSDPGNNGCFAGGTEVTLANGSSTEIETIQIGDSVLTYNFETQMLEAKVVLSIAAPVHFNMIEMNFANGIINSNTFDHPYFVKDKGWASYNPKATFEKYGIKTATVKKGDICFFRKGDNLIEIELTSIQEINGKFKTFNLDHVEGNNNFFANGILVHNKTVPGLNLNIEKININNIELIKVE